MFIYYLLCLIATATGCVLLSISLFQLLLSCTASLSVTVGTGGVLGGMWDLSLGFTVAVGPVELLQGDKSTVDDLLCCDNDPLEHTFSEWCSWQTILGSSTPAHFQQSICRRTLAATWLGYCSSESGATLSTLSLLKYIG